jgi:hypothetical protein
MDSNLTRVGEEVSWARSLGGDSLIIAPGMSAGFGISEILGITSPGSVAVAVGLADDGRSAVPGDTGVMESVAPRRLRGILDRNASSAFRGSLDFRTKSLNFCRVSGGITSVAVVRGGRRWAGKVGVAGVVGSGWMVNFSLLTLSWLGSPGSGRSPVGVGGRRSSTILQFAE